MVFKIDLKYATDIIFKRTYVLAAANALKKVLFVDLVTSLEAAGWSQFEIPAKIEGISFGPDVEYNGEQVHRAGLCGLR